MTVTLCFVACTEVRPPQIGKTTSVPSPRQGSRQGVEIVGTVVALYDETPTEIESR
jgi:hypothetical protein